MIHRGSQHSNFTGGSNPRFGQQPASTGNPFRNSGALLQSTKVGPNPFEQFLALSSGFNPNKPAPSVGNGMRVDVSA
ncbi:MAG: hypothetical protein AAGI66_09715 [Cyanobacteria bacterium P01_H01_bin.74]